jgi:tetratricopeptide (TPR) repeat protein
MALLDEWIVDESGRPTTERLHPKEQELIDLAIAYVRERQYKEALRYFSRATRFTPAALSYFGMALAMTRQRLEHALALCRQAVDREPVMGEYYYHLCQTYLVLGDKSMAVRTCKMGLRAEPRHPRLLSMMKKLGVRRRPIMKFLDREHPVNRTLGKVRHRLKRTG